MDKEKKDFKDQSKISFQGTTFPTSVKSLLALNDVKKTT